MENYDNLGTLGEGTYGVVIKARHKDTGQIVAIKKFKESDEDDQVRKTALREVRILKQLKHDNIVNLVEVFRRKGKLYLVFEYVEKTILEEIEKHPYGLSELEVKKCIYQLLKGVEYCHENNIIHRDIKPENILVGKHGALKLCDFGFARTLGGAGAKYTDYVATRWYRSPELLVGDTEYSKPVDVWAIGCNAAELSNGVPLFPGESDLDQLFRIIKCFGRLTQRQEDIFRVNPLYVGIELPKPQPHDLETIDARFAPTPQRYLLEFLVSALHCNPDQRKSCGELLRSAFFTDGGFADWYEEELRQIYEKDSNPLVVRRKKSRRQQPPAPRAPVVQGVSGSVSSSGSTGHTPTWEMESNLTSTTQQITNEQPSRSSSIFNDGGSVSGEELEPAKPGVLPSATGLGGLSGLGLSVTGGGLGGSVGPVPAPASQGPSGSGYQPASGSALSDLYGFAPERKEDKYITPLKPPAYQHSGVSPIPPALSKQQQQQQQQLLQQQQQLQQQEPYLFDDSTDLDRILPNLKTFTPQLHIPVVAFPHIANDQTTYLIQGGAKKDNQGGVQFPTLNPLGSLDNNGILKYSKPKKPKKVHTDKGPALQYGKPVVGGPSGSLSASPVPGSTPLKEKEPVFTVTTTGASSSMHAPPPYDYPSHNLNLTDVSLPPPSRVGGRHPKY